MWYPLEVPLSPPIRPGDARCFIYVYKEGALSTVGHDVKLEVRRVGLREVSDGALEAELDLQSIEVLGAMKAGQLRAGDLSAKDVRDIKKNIDKDVLQTRAYPKARFRTTSIEPVAGGHRIEAQLDLHGVDRRIVFQTTIADGRATARIPVHMPDFRIKPFKALLGALRVKPEVTVEIIVPVEEA